MKSSKLCAFFQTPPESGAEGTEIVAASSMQWVKGINPDDWATNPFRGKQRVLARLWIGGDGVETNYYMRGAQGAKEYAAMLAPRYAKLRDRGIYDVVAVNEPLVTLDSIYTLEEFQLTWAQIVVSMGMNPWLWSLGSGHPDIGLANRMVNSIAYACAHGGGFETHEYGAPSVLDGGGWWTLRIKRTLAELYAAGLITGNVRVFIGEAGIDGGMIDWKSPEWADKSPRRGWKEWSNWVYPPQYGLRASCMTQELYWRQLSAYDDELLKIPEVVAVSPYITNPEEEWSDFDVNGAMLARMAAKHTQITIEETLGRSAQLYVLPLNPAAALEKSGEEKGYLPASHEITEWWGKDQYIYQVFRDPDNTSIQYIAYAPINNVNDITWFDWQN